ncbi:hypothetical protein ARMSODRAFT_513887 [Armillaria solidipes]|uniref:BTB domain-containing protein n=1 Tax=Armillaria solidipes TaxID=1076256 RepID=A0A2H3C7N9_9AGAR|nr:hypothetical protein ARMSODRAFT_513887 [Armillaria solidipes]
MTRMSNSTVVLADSAIYNIAHDRVSTSRPHFLAWRANSIKTRGIRNCGYTHKPENMNASHPFDNSDPASDIVLISSDDMRFYAHKIILSLASPFFQDLITLAQAPGDGSLPTVPLTEESKIMDKVLRFCYPTFDASFNDVSEVYQVAEAIHKYLMEDVTNRLPSELRAFSDKCPLHAFVIACKLDWREEAELAASKVLARPLLADKEDIPELDLPALGIVHHLLRFHERRLSVIQSAFLCRLDIAQAECTIYGKGPACDVHDVCDDTSQLQNPLPRKSWLLQYGVTVLKAMLLSPTMETLDSADRDAGAFARAVAESCPNCA